MLDVTIDGIVEHVGETEHVGSKGTAKRTLVVRHGRQGMPFAVDFYGGAVAKLDGLSPCNAVKVTAQLRGREYNGKYYVSLSGSEVVRVTAPPVQPPLAPELW